MMIVNENYIKEYEEMSLCDFADELVEPLCIIKKDLTKAIYIRYAEERDKNDELEKENTQFKEVIEEVRKYIEDWLFDAGGNGASMIYEDINELLQILDKVKD